MIRTIMALLLAPALTFGADYYVDFESGDDTNAGTSTGAPWKHCPGDVRATGNASTTLSGGDTVTFKGGVTYYGTNNPIIEINWSGSSGNPITYDGNSAGTWGSGMALITSSNVDVEAVSTDGASRSYINVYGFHFKDIGGYDEADAIWATTNAVTAPPGGDALVFEESGQHINIDGCKFEEIGQWQTKVPMSGTVSMTGNGIKLESNGSVMVSDCEFLRMRIPISIKASGTRYLADNITVTNCTMYSNIVWGVDMAPRANGCVFSNITLTAITMYDYSQCDQGNWTGYGDAPHRDGMFIRTAGLDSVWTNVVVDSCVFRDDNPSTGGTASIFVSQGPSVEIRNCLFLNDVQANGNINVGFNQSGTTGQVVRIYNNTVIGPSRCIRVSPDNSNPAYVEIRNNAMYRTTSGEDALAVEITDVGTLVVDNNRYYNDAALSTWDCITADSDANQVTLAEFLSTYSQESSGLLGSLGVTSISGNPSTWDLSLADGSGCIDAGATLASFSDDILGTSRPQDSAWDIGAYEFGAGGWPEVPDNPPNRLWIGVQ